MKITHLFSLFTISLLIACGNTDQTAAKNEIEVTVKEVAATDGAAKTIAFLGVDGMSCEVGCAGLINKTLNDLKGVTMAEVDFEKKEAKVEFDESILSEKELVSAVEALNDHQYSVTRIDIERRVAAKG